MSNGDSSSWGGDEYSQLLVDQINVLLDKEESFYSCVHYPEEFAVSSEFIGEGWYASTRLRQHRCNCSWSYVGLLF